MTTVRIPSDLFKQRLSLLNQLSIDTEVVYNQLQNCLRRLPYGKEYEYIMDLMVQLQKNYRALYIQSTHRVQRTKKIEWIEIELLLLMAKIRDYFERKTF